MKYICPICQNKTVSIDKYNESNGMDGSSLEWKIYCETCGYSKNYAADNFYGRTYLKTKEEVYNAFCKSINELKETIKNAV